MLIPHGFDLGLSALCASLTLIVNNFFNDQNLTKMRSYSTHFNVSIYEKKKSIV